MHGMHTHMHMHMQDLHELPALPLLHCLCFSQAMQRELDYLELAHQLRGRLTAQRLALQRTDKLAKAVQQRLDALRGARYAPGFT